MNKHILAYSICLRVYSVKTTFLMSLCLYDYAPYFIFAGEGMNVIPLFLDLSFYLHILGLIIDVSFTFNSIFEYKNNFIYLYCNNTVNIRV